MCLNSKHLAENSAVDPTLHVGDAGDVIDYSFHIIILFRRIKPIRASI